MAPIIVLFTDFGLEGPYTGQVKTVLHRIAPGVPVIDLFADLPPAKPQPAAYLLAAYGTWFSAGPIFPASSTPAWAARAGRLSSRLTAAPISARITACSKSLRGVPIGSGVGRSPRDRRR